MLFIESLEFKDWLLMISFGVTAIAAWFKLKSRIDRVDETHSDIGETLVEMAQDNKDRHNTVTDSLNTIGEDIGTIKTRVAVIKNEQINLKDRVERLEIA